MCITMKIAFFCILRETSGEISLSLCLSPLSPPLPLSHTRTPHIPHIMIYANFKSIHSFCCFFLNNIFFSVNAQVFIVVKWYKQLKCYFIVINIGLQIINMITTNNIRSLFNFINFVNYMKRQTSLMQ